MQGSRDVRILIIDSQIYHLSKPDIYVNDLSLIEYKLKKIHSANWNNSSQMKRIINIQYTGKHYNSNEKCAIQMKN